MGCEEMIIPVGTSRIHESLKFFPQNSVRPLHCGYFHSTGQVLDLLRILSGKLSLDSTQARWFFRRDQTPENEFNLDLWGQEYSQAINQMRSTWKISSSFILEITSPRNAKWNGLCVNTNPNIDRQAPYNEIWKLGYYNVHEPDMGVIMSNESPEEQRENLTSIMDILNENGKSAIFLGHLVDPTNPHPARERNNTRLKEAFDGALESQSGGNFHWYDCGHLVSKFGFRILENGETDIHHLPWDALPQLAAELFQISQDNVFVSG